MRPGKQLFPLNYNNIINNKDIKYNIKAIKLVVRETYGGNRTYINQIMFFEQSAEEVKDLLCSNDLNKIYKLNKKLLNNSSSNNNNTSKNINKRKKNNLKEKNKKNKTFEEKQEESDIYKTSDIKNGKENKEIEITPITKKPFRQIKTDIKNSGKNKLKREKLEISLNKENDKKDNLTPNKYLKRIKSLNKGNNTSNYSKHKNNIQFAKNFGFNLKDENSNAKQNLENNSLFNSSLNTNSRINSKNEKDNIMNSNEYENVNTNNYENEEMIEEQQNINSSQFENNNSQYINGQNNTNNNFNNRMNFENIEDNNLSNMSENRQKMYRTHQNINYNQRPNIFFPNLINFKSNNNSNLPTEQNKNEISINSNNNNFSQRYSMITINDNYNNMKKQKINNIKQKLDYLEGNILEIKKTLQEISQGFAFCASKEFIINNFRDQIISICEEIYNEYYPNNNYNINENDNDNDNNNTNYVENEQNGNESLMTNSNYISQNDINNNNQLEKDLENQINQKLDEKLGTLQNNIFDKYLKPTINKIGDSMNKYIEQIQLEVDNINDKPNINNMNTASKNDFGSKLSTSKIRNQKFDEINKIGERLYNKLKEKEKKLILLKQEKSKFLNEGNENH